MLKKTGILSTCSSLPCCAYSHPAAINTSPSSLQQPSGARPRRTRQASSPQWRSFADVRSSKEPDFRDNLHWPRTKSPARGPTPYEIFQLEKSAVYSKHRFYELVKIYHPDRHGLEETYCGGLSQLEKLERYRLVIRAHEILSDPARRKAYDSHGAGWGEPQQTTLRYSTRHSRGYYHPQGDKPYGFGPDCDNSPFANATWEDWERWYHRYDNKDKQQSYAGNLINPNAFASFVILMAVLSGVAQATRAGQYSGSLEDKAKTHTEETSRFMSTRADHYNENNLNSDARVKHFLQKRDPSRYGLKDEEEETYKNHFSDPLIPPPKPPDQIDTSSRGV